MTKKEKQQVAEICRILNETYGTDYKCYLNHENAWQLLIATMLSAQCTDARVNIVTKDLFVKYPTLQAFADADIKELEKDIYSTGFYTFIIEPFKSSKTLDLKVCVFSFGFVLFP